MRVTAAMAVAVAAAVVGGARGEQNCPPGMTYSMCGTACPKLCSDKRTAGGMCIAMCSEGCFCPGGKPWLHEATQTCHASFAECPPSQEV